jgi:magnesium-transporting ATPase (P-type)
MKSKKALPSQTKFTGLTTQQVLENRSKHGSNSTEPEPKNRFWEAFKEIVAEPMFLVLIFTAIIYFALGESWSVRCWCFSCPSMCLRCGAFFSLLRLLVRI